MPTYMTRNVDVNNKMEDTVLGTIVKENNLAVIKKC